MLAEFVFRRALAAIPVVVGVSLITFLLMHGTAGSYIPGLALNPDLTPKDIELLKVQPGLDQPLWIQYLNWTGVAWIMQHVGLGALLVGAHEITQGCCRAAWATRWSTGPRCRARSSTACPTRSS